MIRSERTADAIVVGLGAMGAAALYQLARLGVAAIGIDRFSPPHDLGSSHGETRVTRHAIGEGAAYAPLAMRAHEIWRELEAQTGEALLETCGLLTLAPAGGRAKVHGKPDFLGRALTVADEFGIPTELLSPGEVMRRWPRFHLTGAEQGLYEPGAGMVFPERCIAAQLQEAQQRGARIVRDTRVLSVEDGPASVRIETTAGDFVADQAIVAAGAWTPGLVGGAFAGFALQPQVLHWFAADAPADFAPGRFPVFMWVHGEGGDESFYGFPIPTDAPTRGVKLAAERHGAVASPAEVPRDIPPEAAEEVYLRHVAGRIAGVVPRAVRSQGCVYTTSPDHDFAMGRVGGAGRIVVVSACSGHGFKHSAAIGERLAQHLIDPAAVPLPPEFDPMRFGP
jgi:sarcosine oxidase